MSSLTPTTAGLFALAGRTTRLSRSRPAALLGFGLGLVIVGLARWGPDWPAQEFRAWSAVHDGLSSWTNSWYAGEALPGYSVLYPPLAALLGVGVTGVLAVTISALIAGKLGPSGTGVRVVCYHLAVAVGLSENLLIGQVPFLVGVAFGLGALWTTTRWPLLTAVLAAACSLASPLAGAFVLLAIPALALALGVRTVAPLLAALAGVAVSVVVGGAGGPFPGSRLEVAAVLGFLVLTLLVTTRQDRALRCFAACYAAAGLLTYAVPNPIGDNITRLGKLVALPLACYLIGTGRGRNLKRLVAAGIIATIWPLVPFVSAIHRGARDPSQNAAYYTGLLTFLRTQSPGTGRIEIPFTREHWESLWVARSFPLARGWERQTDLQYNAVLYRPLTAASYRQWLVQNSVSLIALPSVPIDFGGQAEARLLRHPPSYLVPVWSDSHWRVWRVRDPRPLVVGNARLTDLDPSSFTLDFRQPGSATVRIHASRLWQITSGPACIEADSDGWLDVRSSGAGTIVAQARLNPQLLTGTKDCDRR